MKQNLKRKQKSKATLLLFFREATLVFFFGKGGRERQRDGRWKKRTHLNINDAIVNVTEKLDFNLIILQNLGNCKFYNSTRRLSVLH